MDKLLLTDEELVEKLGYLSFTQSFRKELHKVCQAQLLKCHQSESAEIASLQADIEELNILSRCNSEVYDTRIKELETLNYKQSQMKCNRCPYNNPEVTGGKIMLWAAQWHSKNALDGDKKHILYEDCLPMLFRTRARCRKWIKGKYGYIAERPDLRAEPHGWRIPQPVKVEVVLLEGTK